MMAILAEAVRCYQKNVDAASLSKRREFREAQEWLFKENDDGPFSFDSVCYILGTDPGLLRKRLIHWLQTRRECEAPTTPSQPLRRTIRRRSLRSLCI
jgi:hypothetical protein